MRRYIAVKLSVFCNFINSFRIQLDAIVLMEKKQLKTSLIQQIYSRNIQTVNFLC